MNFNLCGILVKLIKFYENETENYRKVFGVLVLSDNEHEKYIALSRTLSRDRKLCVKGYDEFNDIEYNFILKKKIANLPDIDTNSTVEGIDFSWDESDKKECENECELSDEEEAERDLDEENYEMQLLMAQMGFPTTFGSKKNKVREKSSRVPKQNQTQILLDIVYQKTRKLLLNVNDFLYYFLLWCDRKHNQSRLLEFFRSVMFMDGLNDDVKKILESIINSYSDVCDNNNSCILKVTEDDMMSICQEFLIQYSLDICLEEMKNLSLSGLKLITDKDKKQQCLKVLLNGIGLAYDGSINNSLQNRLCIYPIISKNSLSCSKRNGLEFDELLMTAHDQLNENDGPFAKYYAQRYRFFSRFDKGILLDEESWYSVTPGAIAEHVASRFESCRSGDNKCSVVIDAFCGAGGNSIRFAQKGFIVLAVDFDLTKLKLLMHNAAVYNVQKRIVPILCDVFRLNEWIRNSSANNEKLIQLFDDVCAVHFSPPWGGPEYLGRTNFDLTSMNFAKVMEAALGFCPNVACFIPRHSNSFQIIEWFLMRNDGDNCGGTLANVDIVEVEQQCLMNKSKGLTIYTGKLVRIPNLAILK